MLKSKKENKKHNSIIDRWNDDGDIIRIKNKKKRVIKNDK